MIIVNKNKRCVLCQGREVITDSVSSLEQTNKGWVCKDKQECEQNIMAEQTMVNFTVDNNKIIGMSVKTPNGDMDVSYET